jgi:hypothetical protein
MLQETRTLLFVLETFCNISSFVLHIREYLPQEIAHLTKSIADSVWGKGEFTKKRCKNETLNVSVCPTTVEWIFMQCDNDKAREIPVLGEIRQE